MAINVGDIFVRLRAETADFVKGFAELHKGLTATGIIAVAAGNLLSSAMTKVASVLAELPGAFIDNIKMAGRYAEALENMAQSAGVSTTFMQGMRFTLEEAGLGADAATSAFRILSQRMQAAQDDTSDAAYEFEQLDIIITEQSTAEQVIGQVAEAFSQMDDGARKTAMAVDLFGRAGANLIPILNQGQAGIAEAIERARAFGVILDSDTIKKLKETDDSFDRLSAAAKGFSIALAVEAAPATAAFNTALAEMIAKTTAALPAFKTWAKLVSSSAGGALVGAAIVTADLAAKTKQAAQAAQEASVAATAAQATSAETSLKKAEADMRAAAAAVAHGEAERAKGLIIVAEAVQAQAALLAEGKAQEALGAIQLQIIQRTNRERIAEHGLAMGNIALVGAAGIAEEEKGKKIVAAASMVHAGAIQQLQDNANLANGAFELARAKAEAETGFFRDYSATRAARLAQIDADAAIQIQAAQGVASKIIEIEQRAQAQRMAVAQQFPSFWQQQLKVVQDGFAFAWGQITNQISGALAQQIVLGNDWARTFQSLGISLLQSFINLWLQMAVNWLATQAVLTAASEARTGTEIGLHTAMEQAKTAVTAAAETERTVLAVAANAVIAASVVTTLGAIAAVANAALAVVAAVAAGIAGVIYAMAAAVATAGVLFPPAQALAGALIVAATTLEIGAAAAVLTAGAAVQAALGAATIAAAGLVMPLQAGGIVTQPTLAMLGEAGPEAVIPLSQPGGFGQQIIEINVEGRAWRRWVLEGLPAEVRLRAGAIA